MTQARLKFQPKYDKILELLLYLAHKRPNADHYQAIKFMYLADKEHFSRYGRPITFEKYCALPFGPVASNALNLIKQNKATMRKFGVEELPFHTKQLDKTIYIRSPKRAVDHNVFSISDLKVFDEIIERYGQCSFGELYKITHEHFAYENAWSNRGDSNSADMSYEDMIEESSIKAAYIEEIETISDRM